MKAKKAIIVLALLCTFGAVSLPINATESKVPVIGQVIPRMSYISQSYSLIDISGDTATIDAYVERTPYGGKIVMTTKLQCDGKTVKTWTKTESSEMFTDIYKTYTLTKRGKYQVVTSYTVYSADGKYSEYMVDKSNIETY